MTSVHLIITQNLPPEIQSTNRHLLAALAANPAAQYAAPSFPTLNRYVRGRWPSAVAWLRQYPDLLRAMADDIDAAPAAPPIFERG